MGIDTQLKDRDKQGLIKACYTVLKFCYEKKMITKNPLDKDGILKTDFDVWRCDLFDKTDNGVKTFNNFTQKWLGYTDRSQNYDNVKILGKW